MSSESASNSTSNVPVSDAAQESKDYLRLQQPSRGPQLYPANQNPVNNDLEAMVSGSGFLLLNGNDLARVWDQVDSMKAAIEELRSKIEENGTLKAVQSELAILREKLCESIDKLGSKLESNGQTASAGSHGGHPRVSYYIIKRSYIILDSMHIYIAQY